MEMCDTDKGERIGSYLKRGNRSGSDPPYFWPLTEKQRLPPFLPPVYTDFYPGGKVGWGNFSSPGWVGCSEWGISASERWKCHKIFSLNISSPFLPRKRREVLPKKSEQGIFVPLWKSVPLWASLGRPPGKSCCSHNAYLRHPHLCFIPKISPQSLYIVLNHVCCGLSQEQV